MTDTGREPELDVDEPACGLLFLTADHCPDGRFTDCHACWLHENHTDACECDCGSSAA